MNIGWQKFMFKRPPQGANNQRRNQSLMSILPASERFETEKSGRFIEAQNQPRAGIGLMACCDKCLFIKPHQQIGFECQKNRETHTWDPGFRKLAKSVFLSEEATKPRNGRKTEVVFHDANDGGPQVRFPGKTTASTFTNGKAFDFPNQRKKNGRK